MKVYISADIEGVTGVTHWNETELDKGEYGAAREQMTAEVAAACRGALEAGATEILVKDAHDSARNIIAPELPREARLIRGWSGHPFMMMQELDSSFQAAVMIGYHSRVGAGTNPLSHTMTGNYVMISLNGQPASEFLINTYAAASVGVPLVFLSGDRGLCEDVTALNKNIATVAVKDGIGDSTTSIHPGLAVERIQAGVAGALKGDVSRCKVSLPKHLAIEIRFRRHQSAYHTSFFPGVRLVDPYTVRFESDEYFEILRFISFAD
jgi:D-amino peptidase